MGTDFYFTPSYSSKIRLSARFRDYTNRDIRNTLSTIGHIKTGAARGVLNRLNISLKHAVALGLNVDLQTIEKTKALLGKQRHKTINILERWFGFL